MENMWSNVDFDSTIRDFDYTRRAITNIHRVVYSGDFEDMDSEMIFAYLFNEMEIVSFKDFLKRYLYERAQIPAAFHDVKDEVYRDIIMSSFEENYAPHSFEPTTRRWSMIVKSWLTQETVKRSAVFLLGFGLRMSLADVSTFLTKVLKEEDFVRSDPQEQIFRYCYDHTLPYAKAKELLDWYAALDDDGISGTGSEEKAASMAFPANEEELKDLLAGIREGNTGASRGDRAFGHFLKLYDESRELIAGIYTEDEEIQAGRKWTKEDITPADLEKMICSGIPVTGSGNLQKMSSSSLSRHFAQRRMSRQRIDGLLQKKLQVERFDLITLMFFIYAQEQLDLEPEIRCKNFIDATNEMLADCRMMALYPVNPYESFVMMCLLSEGPLATYAEIWEMSYT